MRANRRQDEKIYLLYPAARRAWRAQPDYERLPGETAFDYLKKLLEKKFGYRYKDVRGVEKAYQRGRKAHVTQNFDTKKQGRPTSPDAVAQCIIYDLVCAALSKGSSLREACRIASRDELATIWNSQRRIHRPSPGAVQAIYLKLGARFGLPHQKKNLPK